MRPVGFLRKPTPEKTLEGVSFSGGGVLPEPQAARNTVMALIHSFETKVCVSSVGASRADPARRTNSANGSDDARHAPDRQTLTDVMEHWG